MNYYYLVSQLPNISNSQEGKSSLPITSDEFRELSSRFLLETEKKIISNLSLVPPRSFEKTSSDFLDIWYDKERSLRFALAQIRAQKMKKEAYQVPSGCTADILQAARTAVGMDSPLSAEQFLFEYRMKLLDDLRPINGFSVDAVYAYGIRLLLVERIKKFDSENGKTSYHKIYDTILGETK